MSNEFVSISLRKLLHRRKHYEVFLRSHLLTQLSEITTPCDNSTSPTPAPTQRESSRYNWYKVLHEYISNISENSHALSETFTSVTLTQLSEATARRCSSNIMAMLSFSYLNTANTLTHSIKLSILP